MGTEFLLAYGLDPDRKKVEVEEPVSDGNQAVAEDNFGKGLDHPEIFPGLIDHDNYL